ncbi:NnrS family protein [Parapusillimonas sp. JC17]|uniref:NnrS family protein n=1 Tax=Parapusillimonas sp. JC17 TaxID=3445768 RepID=UPI003F9EC10D
MAELLSISEPRKPRPDKPDLTAFLSLGFRPLYIAGCAWALVSIGIWIYAPQWLSMPLGGVAWHAHEMLWAFIGTIAVAFLLTASATWTGFNPLKGWPLAGLTALWLIARIGFLAGGETAFHIACASELAFYLISAACLMRVMIKGKSRRNYGVPFMLLALGIADALFLRATLRGDYIALMQHFDLGLLCMAMIALLIARRVIPFFSMRMVPGLEIPMLVRSGHVQLVLSAAAILLGLAGQGKAMGAALFVVGLVSLWQLARWKPLAVLHKPMLWILYLGYGAMGIGLMVAAVQLGGLSTGVLARNAAHVHLIGMGGFAVLIIGMLTRTALGHLGRPLALDGSMLLSYYLMIAAVVLRLAALWPSSATLHLLHAAALSWIACMGLYLWRFVPMLIRPRYTAPVPQPAKPAGAPLASNIR